MDIALWSAAHLLVIGYWLGTDLAVYYLSGAIVDPSRPLPARMLATRAMLVLEASAASPERRRSAESIAARCGAPA